MNVIVRPRQGGKTVMLIEEALKHPNSTIFVTTLQRKRDLYKTIRDLHPLAKFDPTRIVTLQELEAMQQIRRDPEDHLRHVYVDNAEEIIARALGIFTSELEMVTLNGGIEP